MVIWHWLMVLLVPQQQQQLLVLLLQGCLRWIQCPLVVPVLLLLPLHRLSRRHRKGLAVTMNKATDTSTITSISTCAGSGSSGAGRSRSGGALGQRTENGQHGMRRMYAVHLHATQGWCHLCRAAPLCAHASSRWVGAR